MPDTNFNIDHIPVILAANRTIAHRQPHQIQLIVIHCPTGGPYHEHAQGAEGVANYFHRGGSGVGSAHLVNDNDSIIRCVYDKDVAWGGTGSNHNGLHIEVNGSADQSAIEWTDQYSRDALTIGAEAVRQWCDKYDIPKVKISRTQADNGVKGIIGHDERGGGHYDPGPHFPWEYFINLVNGEELSMGAVQEILKIQGDYEWDTRRYVEDRVKEEGQRIRIANRQFIRKMLEPLYAAQGIPMPGKDVDEDADEGDNE